LRQILLAKRPNIEALCPKQRTAKEIKDFQVKTSRTRVNDCIRQGAAMDMREHHIVDFEIVTYEQVDIRT